MTTLVKFHNKPAKTFNNLVDDFFATIPSIISDDLIRPNRSFTPVNVKETEKDFVLEVVAPGFQKEDFQINLDNNTLTISAELKAESRNERFVRKEYKQQSLKRSFTIDSSVDAEGITAKYVNGILILNLLKRIQVKESAKEITIQ